MIEIGRTYTAKHQGKTITPQNVDVTVVWIESGHVHYVHTNGGSFVHQTPLERFMEIVS